MKRNRSRSREFEALTARIEAALAPTGAKIRSPDRIRDKLTGLFREVDASVRYTVGSCDLLITIECRDRSRTQDVTWIEQLATKRVHIGADRTIAVSSSPFTAAALRAAQAHGISTRLISEISDEEIRSFTDQLEVTVESIELSLLRMQLTYSEVLPRSPVLDPGAASAWNADCWNAQIFHVAGGDRPVSLTELIHRAGKCATAAPTGAAVTVTVPPKSSFTIATDPLSPHLRDLPASGKPSAKHFTLIFDTERITVSTDLGIKQLRAIAFEVRATRKTELVPPRRIGEYASDEKLITRFVEREVKLDEGKTFNVLSRPTPPEGST
jgi:hypothetical protein